MVDRVPPADSPVPLVPVVARLYTQNGYRRASVKGGPGTPLVQLVDAEAAIGIWRQRAELRKAAFNDAIRERDCLLAAAIDAVAALSKVDRARSYAEAISVCVELQRAIASLK